MLTKLKADLLDLRKAKSILAPTLAVVIGDIETAQARGNPLTDEQITQVIRKLIKSNQETRALMVQTMEKDSSYGSGFGPSIALIDEQCAFLQKYLPAVLSAEQVKNELTAGGVYDKLSELSNVGQKLGVAMKYLKEKKLSVDPTIVKQVI